MTKLEIAAIVEVAVCWLLWFYPFIKVNQEQAGKKSVVTAPVAKLGIWLQGIAFFLAWVRIGPRAPGFVIAGMVLAPLSTLLVWTAIRHLGRQWRIQAGLYADHELIRSGPYSFVRHPIYLSLFGMMLAAGFVMSIWPVVLVAAVLFLTGAEIRIRAEDQLLRSRFGEEFEKYRASVPAYIPFLR